ncbi:MAG: MarC family protein [Candidatus Azotimanducaceae bacterium]|jgi:multiple antibiotic resistance protein
MPTLFLENLILIFVAIDPIGLLPIFAPFTQGLSKTEVRRLTLQSGFTALCVLLAFWLFGSTVLHYMGISIDSFKIIGGLFLIVIAYQMLFEQRQEQRQDTMDKAMRDKALSSLATFPIAIPLIAGPGAIAITMLMQEKSNASVEHQIIGFLPILLILMMAATSLWLSSKVAKALPESVVGAIQRVFGLLLGALAIEFVIDGIKATFGLS